VPRNDRSKKPAPRRGLTAFDALARLSSIEIALDSLCETAPQAVAAMGGRDALLGLCQLTCVGPVPRLSEPAWERMAAEHAERQWSEGVGLKPWRGPKPSWLHLSPTD
jgi:hypothetical protein